MHDPHNTLFQLAYDLVNFTDMHLFLTGEAGTGKTTFLRYLKQHTHKQFAIAAPSGVAAIHAGGTTLHSLLQLPVGGVYLPEGSANAWMQQESAVRVWDKHSVLANLRIHGNKRKLLQELELLIIDEVSMVRADTLDMINTILQSVRKNKKPFGGLQMLYIGDLYQLPPVVKNEEEAFLNAHYQSPYFFDAKVIAAAPPQFLALDKVYRQRDDAFIAVLNRVRNNRMDAETLATINARHINHGTTTAPKNLITLTSHNNLADMINRQALAALPEAEHHYKAVISREFPPKNFPVDEHLQLKKGARVMFVKNDTTGARQYFNGKMGTIISLSDDEVTVQPDGGGDDVVLGRAEWANTRYRWNDQKKNVEEEVMGSFEQFPLRLAWAISIHKSQGLTFEKMIVDAARSFTAGQVYVALSRATELSGIWLSSAISADVIAVHPRVVRFHERDRPVHALTERVAIGKRKYIEKAFLQVFDFGQYRLSLAALNLIYQQMAPMDAEPFLLWQQKVKSAMHGFEQQTTNWLPDLEKLTAQMHSSEGAEQLNEWLQLHAADFLRNAANEMDGWKKWLPSRFALAHTEHYEPLEDLLKKFFDKLQAHRTKMLRLQLGYSEETFFPNSRYETETDEHKHKKKTVVDRSMAVSVGDTDLLEALKQTVRNIAAEREVPVYVVLAFRYLDAIAATMPETLDELEKLPGFGKKNLTQIGPAILETVAEYRLARPFAKPVATVDHFTKAKRKIKGEPKVAKEDTVAVTLGFWEKGMPVEEIAISRSMVVGTIKGHFARAIKNGLIDGKGMVSEAIIDAVNALSPDDNSPLRPEMLRDRYGITADWGDLQIARALLALRNTTETVDNSSS